MVKIAPSVVARVEGIREWEPALLYQPEINLRFGISHLAQTLRRYARPEHALAAYNAGPSRVDEWVRRYGDPRGKPLEWVVDWMERIPYTETRNYVQRVMENYQVYKMRLTGRFSIAEDLRRGG